MSKNFVSNDDALQLFGKIGDRMDLSPTTFTGTHIEWNNLTQAQKAEYEIVNFTDDYSPGADAVIITEAESCLTGDTSCTFINGNLHTTSMIDVYCQNVSGDVTSITNVLVTEGQAVVSFDALAEDTYIKLLIRNPE